MPRSRGRCRRRPRPASHLPAGQGPEGLDRQPSSTAFPLWRSERCPRCAQLAPRTRGRRPRRSVPGAQRGAPPPPGPPHAAAWAAGRCGELRSGRRQRRQLTACWRCYKSRWGGIRGRQRRPPRHPAPRRPGRREGLLAAALRAPRGQQPQRTLTAAPGPSVPPWAGKTAQHSPWPARLGCRPPHRRPRMLSLQWW